MLSERFVEFLVEGEPKGQPRPRMTTVGGHARSYDPSDAVLYKNFVKIKCLEALKEEGIDYINPVSDHGFRVQIFAYKEPPKSFSKKKTADAIAQRIDPLTKPDVDNIAKIILDACSGVLWKDDKEITDLRVKKFYGLQSIVIVTVSWTEEV